jgi:hypothetical protein
MPSILIAFAVSLSLAEDVVRVEKPGPCRARVGQEIAFVFRSDGFSGMVITNLRVSVEGQRLKNPRIESGFAPCEVDVVEIAVS